MNYAVNLDSAVCAGTSHPDYWLTKENHRLASKMCFTCAEQVDCYLTALVERKYGTWGGVWFPESVAQETRTSAMLMRAGRVKSLRRTLRRVALEVSRRLGMTFEEYTEKYGQDEVGVYRAVTGRTPEKIRVMPR